MIGRVLNEEKIREVEIAFATNNPWIRDLIFTIRDRDKTIAELEKGLDFYKKLSLAPTNEQNTILL